MGIKELYGELGTALNNEFIQVRADQVEMGQALTERINGVADRVKILDRKVDALEGKVDVLDTKVDALEKKVDILDTKVGRLETKVSGLEGNQFEMMNILIAIQRKLDIDQADVDQAGAEREQLRKADLN